MQLERKGLVLYGAAYILWSIGEKIVLTVSRSQRLYTSTNLSLSLLYILIAFFEGEGSLKVTESSYLLKQNQMINYFLGGFVPLKTLSQKSKRTHEVVGKKLF